MAGALDRHLALIGFMGAGKSTLGAEVAGRIGRAFVDLDREIESRTGSTIPELFAEGGEAGFRAIEEEASPSSWAGPCFACTCGRRRRALRRCWLLGEHANHGACRRRAWALRERACAA